MDDSSKKAALEKVSFIFFFESNFFLSIAFFTSQFISKADLMNVKIGYPDYTFNDTYMNDLYEGVSQIITQKK
jgi:hypothetical protein